MITPEFILSQTAHRPWPLPQSPWIMFQQWSDLLFAHWAIDPEIVRALVPAELELDLFGAKAWVSVTPFRMTDIHLRGLPPLPGASGFLEMNLRTYVRGAVGGAVKPGVYFFSLDASNLPAVAGARLGFGLPYHWADMTATDIPGGIHYTSERRKAEARLAVEYFPTGEVLAEKSALQHFLTERYCLYEVRAGVPMCAEIHHLPWPLQDVRVSILANTLGRVHGLPLSSQPDVVNFSRQLDVLVFPPAAA